MNQQPELLTTVTTLLNSQAGPGQTVIRYGLCLLLKEANLAELVTTESSRAGPICCFETVTGQKFWVVKPSLIEAEEEDLLALVQEMIGEFEND